MKLCLWIALIRSVHEGNRFGSIVKVYLGDSMKGKLIGVAPPLDTVNKASAREKSIRQG